MRYFYLWCHYRLQTYKISTRRRYKLVNFTIQDDVVAHENDYLLNALMKIGGGRDIYNVFV